MVKLPLFNNTNKIKKKIFSDLLIEHHLVKGLPATYRCKYCNKNLTRNQFINFCSMCLNKYTKLLILFRSRQIDVRLINFRFNVLNDRMITLKRK